MAYADQFSKDPAANSKAPPNGAPQGGLSLKKVSATVRVVMAGIAECWQGGDSGIGVRDLKGMAKQDPADVDITGGTLGPGVTVNGSINTVFGLDPQEFYDLVFPIGVTHFFYAGTGPVVPPWITATWAALGEGNYIVTADILAGDHGTTGGSSNTGDAGSVSAGVSGGHTLTLLETPTGVVVDVTTYAPPTTPDQANFGTEQSINSVKNAGGGQSHTHSLPAITAHHHTIDPPKLKLAAYRRVS